MAKAKLDPVLLQRMARATKKDKQYLREQISRMASRAQVSSIAAQLRWARDLGLGIGRALNQAEPSVREEVRSGMVALQPAHGGGADRRAGRQRRQQPITAAVIRFLLLDPELRARCSGLLLDRRHYDRVVREATTVLDDRLKRRSGITHMNPSDLVGKALSPDPNKAVIVVSTAGDKQRGVFNLCSGVMLAFRNAAHHNLTNAFSQADGLKFCGFIDTLLGLINNGTVHPERI